MPQDEGIIDRKISRTRISFLRKLSTYISIPFFPVPLLRKQFLRIKSDCYISPATTHNIPKTSEA